VRRSGKRSSASALREAGAGSVGGPLTGRRPAGNPGGWSPGSR
jgi:hypothetical protein